MPAMACKPVAGRCTNAGTWVATPKIGGLCPQKAGQMQKVDCVMCDDEAEAKRVRLEWEDQDISSAILVDDVDGLEPTYYVVQR